MPNLTKSYLKEDLIYIKGCLKDFKNAWRGDKGY